MGMRARRGFVFDLDGTLVDTMPLHYLAWSRVSGRHGLPFSHNRFLALAGVPTRETGRRLIEESGIALDLDLLVRDKEAEYEALIARRENIRPVEPVLRIASACRCEGPLAIASSSPRRLVAHLLTSLGIAEWFAAIVAEEDIRHHKPAPDAFVEAARRLGLPPEVCTAYEDTDVGLEAARRAGMPSVDVRLLVP